jgi:uncharacterized linocin/CFP29 family protein
MNHLMRPLAPITSAGWKQIDQEARERLTPHLAARRVVDVSGPHGWQHSSVDLGRIQPLDSTTGGETGEGVRVRRRQVQPLIEVRVPFTVSRGELDDADRGADDIALDDLDRAAHELAVLENKAVFHGWAGAGITGIAKSSPHEATTLGTDAGTYPHAVAKAVDVLQRAGIAGPYALAIAPAGYTRIVESTESGGVLVFDHLHKILGNGKIVRSPGLTGAIVTSTAGGDFELSLGQDISVGYSHYDADTVHLYLEESFTFRVIEADAAIALTD